ncbi:MAG TPA: CPBP family intramembrane glutamic endopeptidase [Brevefilum sp.]
MDQEKSFFKNNAVLVYFALTLLITWGGIFLAVGMDGILGTVDIPDAQMPLLYSVTLLGPSIAGLVAIALFDGKKGFRSLFSRLGKWRVALGWYAIALLTAPILITLILLIASLFSPAYLPTPFTEGNDFGLLLTGIFMGLAVGFFEELGWTGFAVPRLRQKYSVLTTGILLGLFWGLWHLPLFVASANSSGAVPPVLYLLILLFSFLPAYRALMVWVYDQTGSLLIMVLMHAPLSASQLLLIPPDLSGIQLVLYDITFAAALWLIAAAVVIFSKRQLTAGEKTA